MVIHQIIYCSIATQCFGRSSWTELVQQARIHNFSQDVTGILLYADQHYLQVLEGEREAVE